MPWNKPYHPAGNQPLDPEVYKHSYRVYFLTIRSYKNQHIFVKYDINRMVLDTMNEELERQNFVLYTYCLMPDHIHYLISPREDGLSVLDFTNQFKGKTTNRSWHFGHKGKLWQPRFYDHIIRTDESLIEIGRYILENPIRKKYVDHYEQWLWSGQTNPFPID
jgi:putative transposase